MTDARSIASRLTGILLFGAVLVSAAPAGADGFGGVASGNSYILDVRVSAGAEASWLAAKASGAPAARLVEYTRAELCDVSSQFLTSTLDGTCDPGDGAITPPDCGP